MFRCHFCTGLAVLECSENRFCLKHRSEHNDSHNGFHDFKDIFARLSKQGKIDFRNEICNRLKTLKEYKKILTAAIAEYSKGIQAMFSQKIAEVDQIRQSYIELITKKPLDMPDA